MQLSADTKRTLEAAMDRMLPAGPGQAPGARDAHVIGYVEWLVGQKRFESNRERLQAGTLLLDEAALGLWGLRFADCGPTQQDLVLQRLYRAPHPTPKRFVRMLVNIALAGFLGDPRYGGNRGSVSWRWIGFRPDLEPDVRHKGRKRRLK